MATLSQFVEVLRYADQDLATFELRDLRVFDPVLPVLATLDIEQLHELLLTWNRDYESGSYLLLQAIAASKLAGALAPGFAHKLNASWDEDPEYLDPILAAGIEQGRIETVAHAWILERPGVRACLGLEPLPEKQRLGLDDRPLPEVLEPLPDVTTVAGVQARLLLYEFNCGPITGEWNLRTRTALQRLQYECFHQSPSGELDEQTLQWLRNVE